MTTYGTWKVFDIHNSVEVKLKSYQRICNKHLRRLMNIFYFTMLLCICVISNAKITLNIG